MGPNTNIECQRLENFRKRQRFKNGNLTHSNAGSAQKHVVSLFNPLLVDPSKPILFIL